VWHGKVLALACVYAARKQDYRTFRLAAVGIRTDGVLVHAANLASQVADPTCHAEWRLCRKLDKGATVYVARVGADGQTRLARPCESCQRKLRRHGVVRVFYTIGLDEYGVMSL
jgi:cytidine deaminase